ncbi:MAG TPA: GNAT family N-acetyltransferase [Gaiella sp.]
MFEVRTCHTSSLDGPTLAALRRFLDEAFSGEFGDEDWDHALGGMHAVGTEDGTLVAHASVVQRRLFHGGHSLRTGYVEAVAVRADRRRRGYGRAVMERIGEVIGGAYELGALAAGEDGARLYRALGWRAWEGRTWVLAPTGRERTPEDDDAVYVLPGTETLDLAGDLACDWREGAVW